MRLRLYQNTEDNIRKHRIIYDNKTYMNMRHFKICDSCEVKTLMNGTFY